VPIVVNLDVMLARRNMRHSELSNLKTGKARAVRFSTLAAICEVLQCQPGDVLEFIPEPAVTKPW
jgi:putative transcriptional regulator